MGTASRKGRPSASPPLETSSSPGIPLDPERPRDLRGLDDCGRTLGRKCSSRSRDLVLLAYRGCDYCHYTVVVVRGPRSRRTVGRPEGLARLVRDAWSRRTSRDRGARPSVRLDAGRLFALASGRAGSRRLVGASASRPSASPFNLSLSGCRRGASRCSRGVHLSRQSAGASASEQFVQKRHIPCARSGHSPHLIHVAVAGSDHGGIVLGHRA